MRALLIPHDARPTEVDVPVIDGIPDAATVKSLIFGERDGIVGFSTFGRRFAVYLDDLGALTDQPVNEVGSTLLEYPVLYGNLVMFGLEQYEGDAEPIRVETIARAQELWGQP